MTIEIWVQLLDNDQALVATRDEELNTIGTFIIGNIHRFANPIYYEPWGKLIQAQHEQWAEAGIYIDRPYEGIH